jgi:hypothetical protein
MHMARVNVYLPDRLHEQAKRAGLNVSELSQAAIEEELARRKRLRALERYASDLEERFGPASADEVAAAEEWVNDVLRTAKRARSSSPRRTRTVRRSA